MAGTLAHQAYALELGLTAVGGVVQDATGAHSSATQRLHAQLARLTSLSQPIYDQAVRLTLVEKNISAAKQATEELAVHLRAPQQVCSRDFQGASRV
jgi:hypothetical protein